MLRASTRYPPDAQCERSRVRSGHTCRTGCSVCARRACPCLRRRCFDSCCRPSARILRVPGEIEIEEWKCLAELIDTAFDDFNKIMIFIILEAGPRDDVDSHCAPASPPPASSMPSQLPWPRALCWRCCCQLNCSTVLCNGTASKLPHFIVPTFCRDLGRRLSRGEEVVDQRRGARCRHREAHLVGRQIRDGHVADVRM